MYLIALSSALITETPLVIALASASVIAVSLGYRYRNVLATFAAGWALYFPLAVAFSLVLGPIPSYLASALVVTVLPERLSFDSELSLVLEAPMGVDAEALSLAGRLSSTHSKRVGEFLLVVAVVFAASVPLARLTPTVAVVMSVAVVLMFAAYGYVRRGSLDRGDTGQGL